MRVHNSTDKESLYPHDLTGAELDAYRRYARAKSRLAPAVDALTRAGERDGSVGPVRPLVLDDPSPEARSVDDQWLVGRDLLVAPVLQPGATSRSVYLPAGARWQPVRVADDGALVPSGAAQAGGQRLDVPVTLADVPLFTRLASPAAPAGPAAPGPGAGAGRGSGVLAATGPAAPYALLGGVLLAAAAWRRRA
jgi:alpha-glucosidase (family GH31 glycosyl hydrolase)